MAAFASHEIRPDELPPQGCEIGGKRLPGCDVGEGWWIFDFKEGDLGVHPTMEPGDAGQHDISFYCDDIHGTVAELKSRGVEFKHDVEDHGYGLVTHILAPGGITVQLYEPRYAKKPAAV